MAGSATPLFRDSATPGAESGRRRLDAAERRPPGLIRNGLPMDLYETYGKVSALIFRKPEGGRGKSRKADDVETGLDTFL